MKAQRNIVAELTLILAGVLVAAMAASTLLFAAYFRGSFARELRADVVTASVRFDTGADRQVNGARSAAIDRAVDELKLAHCYRFPVVNDDVDLVFDFRPFDFLHPHDNLNSPYVKGASFAPKVVRSSSQNDRSMYT